jgi:hypothetical protein
MIMSDKDLDAILTDSQKIYKDSKGIVHCVNLPIERHTLEHAKSNLEVIKSLAGDKKCPVIVDIRNTRSIDGDARKFYAGAECAEVQSAAALIIGSSLTKMVANFFLGLNKPLFPTKLFTDENEAIAWLMELGGNE